VKSEAANKVWEDVELKLGVAYLPMVVELAVLLELLKVSALL